MYFTSYHIFSLHNVSEEYVYHPINAYNLIKRVTKYLPKVTNNEFIKTALADTDYIMYQIGIGMYNLMEYYAIPPMNLIKGILIQTPKSNEMYKSEAGLSLKDMQIIQNIAKEDENYDVQITILNSILALENNNTKISKNLR